MGYPHFWNPPCILLYLQCVAMGFFNRNLSETWGILLVRNLSSFFASNMDLFGCLETSEREDNGGPSMTRVFLLGDVCPVFVAWIQKHCKLDLHFLLVNQCESSTSHRRCCWNPKVSACRCPDKLPLIHFKGGIPKVDPRIITWNWHIFNGASPKVKRGIPIWGNTHNFFHPGLLMSFGAIHTQRHPYSNPEKDGRYYGNFHSNWVINWTLSGQIQSFPARANWHGILIHTSPAFRKLEPSKKIKAPKIPLKFTSTQHFNLGVGELCKKNLRPA